MLDVSESDPGLPAECHVISQKRGPVWRRRSNREMRLMAPSLVFGGKNSNEKNGKSFNFSLWRIRSIKDTYWSRLVGHFGLLLVCERGQPWLTVSLTDSTDSMCTNVIQLFNSSDNVWQCVTMCDNVWHCVLTCIQILYLQALTNQDHWTNQVFHLIWLDISMDMNVTADHWSPLVSVSVTLVLSIKLIHVERQLWSRVLNSSLCNYKGSKPWERMGWALNST